MKIEQLLRDNAGREPHPVNLIRNEADATLYLYGIISEYEVSAGAVIQALSGVTGASTLNLRINSPGGDVFEARAIIEAIKRFDGKTVAHIDSLAASSASSIALAADEVRIAKGAFFMIHNAKGGAFGDKKDLRDRADLIEKVELSIAAEYAEKTGKTLEDVIALMEAETWFSADEAVENGFADRLADTAIAKNTWNLAAFANAPKALCERAAPEVIDPAPKPIPQDPALTVANTNRLRLLQIV